MSDAARAGEATASDGSPPEWLPLDRDERIVWRGGPRIQTTYPALALALVGVLLGALALVGDAVPRPVAGLAPVAVAVAGWSYLRVARTTYVVTTAAAYARSGVLGVRVTALDLERVQNSSASQHALGRALGYGTVTVDAAGGDGAELEFRSVENPGRVRSLVDARADRARGDDVPGTVEQWEAVLEEVRGWRRAVDRGR